MARVKFRRPWFGPDGVLYDAGVNDKVPTAYLGDGETKKSQLPSTAVVLSEADRKAVEEKPENTDATPGKPVKK